MNKVKIVFETRMTLKNQLEYWYNKALAPFGVVFLFTAILNNNWIFGAIGGIMVTLGFLTEIRFEEKEAVE